MHLRSIDRLFDRLDRARRAAGDSGEVPALLAALDRATIADADRLARFHDALLFLAAYPATPGIRRSAEAILKRFGRRVAGSEMPAYPGVDISGIAGTRILAVFSYDFVLWLTSRFPRAIGIDWDETPEGDRMASFLTLVVPFIEEEANVDANVSFREWLDLRAILDLVGQIEPPHLRAPLYDSLGIWIDWKLGNSTVTRTRMRRPPRSVFHQQTPLLARRDVSIARELAGPPLPITRLSRREGEEALDMARTALATRYRELYSFTYGDPSTVLSADCRRGLEVLLFGVVPEKRLPLRAGFAPLILRNGVPIGYGDAFALFERMEVSLNLFYAFRDGESAYCLAKLLQLYQQLFGSTTFTIDPYQIGMENEEAIESGAFWFYRKLGFRPMDAAIERMTVREEARMAKDPAHRTSARVLRGLARGPMIFESEPSGAWERFQLHRISLAAADFTPPDADRVAHDLQLDQRSLTPRQQRAFVRLAPVLALIPRLSHWSGEERGAVIDIIRAKAGRDERTYLRRMLGHRRLRLALLNVGRVL